MLKTKLIPAMGIVSCSLAVNAFAGTNLVSMVSASHASKSTALATVSDKTLGDISVTTPGNRPVLLKSFTAYVGYAPGDSACSDFYPVVHLDSDTAPGMAIFPGTAEMTSSNLKLLDAGITCMRIDFSTDNKNYTTGSLKFGWDAEKQSYMSMTPSHVDIHVTA